MTLPLSRNAFIQAHTNIQRMPKMTAVGALSNAERLFAELI